MELTPPFGYRPVRASVRWFDVATAVVIGGLSVGLLVFKEPEVGDRAFDALAWVLALAAAGALVPRRRWPMATLAVAFLCATTWVWREYGPGPIIMTVIVALYTVAERGDRRRTTWVGIAIMAIGAFVVAVHWRDGFDALGALAGFGWFCGSLFAGDAVRSHRAYVAAIEQRARDAEQSREEEARRRVDEERLRIARELHDVVAHSIATINVQSGVAAHVMDQRPEEARNALLAIKESSREALRELRATLSVLRAAGEAEAPREPAPGLGDLRLLIETTRQSGLDIELRGDLEDVSVPPAVGLTAYRVVQEGLTNVLRHAGPAQVVVEVAVLDNTLVVDVVDDGLGSTPQAMGTSEGHGLMGMRERAHAVGGVFDAGPNPGGGFRVHVALPIAGVRV